MTANDKKPHFHLAARLAVVMMVTMAAFAGGADAEVIGAKTFGTKTLEPCHLPNHRQEVLCGSHTVFENRAAGEGRQLEIHFAVMPAVGEKPEPDPVVVFAGGPGQAAMEMAPLARRVFTEVGEKRDIVLIDQRGMGSSAPLDCEMPEEEINVAPRELQRLALEAIEGCLESWDADVSLYTQDLANEDIHEILEALGYAKVNLFGASWGTRSALLYAHRYPEQVRSVLLDGALPPRNTAPLFAAVDADRALRELFVDCAEDAACRGAFPDLEGDFRDALELLRSSEPDGDGVEVELQDPITGEPFTGILNAELFGGILRSILYSPDLSRSVPLMIHRAAGGDYRPLLGVASFLGTASRDSMTVGASLAIFCAEELARGGRPEESEGERLLGQAMLVNLANACEVWPKTTVPPIYGEDIRSDAPALILSGEVDPITPPRWGEAMAEALPRSVHLVAPNTGHNVAPVGCASDLVTQFIEEAATENLDASCLEEIERPSFFIDAAGPSMEGGQDRAEKAEPAEEGQS